LKRIFKEFFRIFLGFIGGILRISVVLTGFLRILTGFLGFAEDF